MCSATMSQMLFSIWDDTFGVTLIYQQTMSSNVFRYTFTPVTADVGVHTW